MSTFFLFFQNNNLEQIPLHGISRFSANGITTNVLYNDRQTVGEGNMNNKSSDGANKFAIKLT